jgi:cytosine/adenosine deaminase-related metal-dependent hydrolase
MPRKDTGFTMRFLSADIIFPIHSRPIANGIIGLSTNGTIKHLWMPDDVGIPDENRIERFTGILCPGFVNSHCHLELSHMKEVVPEKTGLPAFITDIVSKRHLNAELKTEKIAHADEEMWRNGILAVGDICNTTDTIDVKKSSRINYHSFVEVFSFDPNKAAEVLTEGMRVAKEYRSYDLVATVVPHAPYSVSSLLFNGIMEQQSMFPGPISIHNQETVSEDQMFLSGTGALVETFKGFGVDFSTFNPTGGSALAYALPHLSGVQNVMLVHNTLTSKAEMVRTNAQRDNVYWCTCPTANSYIEDRIPDLPMWIEAGSKVCVGTDSLASNHQLSILEELKLIQSKFPEMELNNLLKMATLNGAKALQMHQNLGSFEIGKTPGVVQLKNVDLTSGRLTDKSAVQRII